MSRDETQPLKRFRNLDIDGVVRPPRPKPPGRGRAEPSQPSGTRPPTGRVGAPNRAPATAPSRPPAPAPSAPPRRANVPDGPAPQGMIREAVRIDLTGGASRPARPMAPPSGPRRPEPLPPGTRPGIVTVDLVPPPRYEPAPPPRIRSVGLAPPLSNGAPPPIELTEIAARQIRLMAYQHGVTGAGLRILTSGPGGPDNCDFAFDNEPDPDDVVFLSQGIRVIVDQASLRTLRGLRVTYQDLPGAEGFRLS